MAGSDQIKSLIKSFGEGDEARFFASAMQIAASEARQGHANFAHELKKLIEAARKNRSGLQFDHGKVVNMAPGKREIGDLIEVSQSRIKLADMVLVPKVHQQLSKLVAEQRKWELLRHHNLHPVRKLLLTGPPGTGKTMTAHAIAGELSIPVYIIRLDGLLSRYMGESIAKLRIIFDQMPANRAVYLFDEFDSIGSHRHTGNDVGEIKRVLNSFLVYIEKDVSNSVIVAATNLPDMLDNALMRRFDEIIKFPLPSDEEIANALKKYTRGYSMDSRANFSAMAGKLNGLNFSDISKAAEATIKEKILSGSPKLHKDYLMQQLLTKLTDAPTTSPQS